MSKVFINYRRSDTEGYAGHLFDDLQRHFASSTEVFMDIPGLTGGDPVREVITREIRTADALIVLIGKSWLSPRDGAACRLDDANDLLRIEIETAFLEGIPVIPVLVEGATMPNARDLPPPLVQIRDRNGLPLGNRTWQEDVNRIIEAIHRHSERNRERQIEKTLQTALENARRGFEASKGHPVFIEEVEERCNLALKWSEDWALGKVTVPTRRYRDVLLTLYEQAKVSVFSTSVTKYFEIWLQPLGDEIIAAHLRSNARTIHRVFSFPSSDDVDDHHMRVMERQAETGRINVRVHCKSTVVFPDDVSDDFTIIDDGEVIARTIEYSEPAAVFHFHDFRRKKALRDLRAAIMRESVTLDKFRMAWNRSSPES